MLNPSKLRSLAKDLRRLSRELDSEEKEHSGMMSYYSLVRSAGYSAYTLANQVENIACYKEKED